MTTSSFRIMLEQYWFQRRHTALLVAIVVALAVRPVLGDTGAGPVIFSLALLLLFLMALLTMQVDELVGERNVLLAQRRRRGLIGLALAAPAVFERLAALADPSPRLYLMGSISWFLFFSFITWSELRMLLKQREITGEAISMAMSTYLLFGLTWGVFYMVLFLLDGQAFSLGASMPLESPDTQLHVFPTLIYFSLTTISTVGYGDITPLTLPSRYAAVAEAIAGQFYMAILVARLVSMQLSRAVMSDNQQ